MWQQDWPLSKKHGEKIKKITGNKLLDELNSIIEIMKTEEWKRSLDRASYIILQNISRLEDSQQQEDLIVKMLDLNKYPSKGVIESLANWQPVKIPKKLLRKRLSCVLSLEQLLFFFKKSVGETWEIELIEEFKDYFVEQDKFKEAIFLLEKLGKSEKYKQNEISTLIEQMVEKAILKRKQEISENIDKNESETLEYFIQDVVQYSIKYKLRMCLIKIRNNDELCYGDTIYSWFVLPAAIISGEKKWIEKGLENEIAILQGAGNDHSNLAMMLDVIKNEEFKNFRRLVFDALIKSIKGTYHKVWNLKRAAEIAVYYNNPKWQMQCYNIALGELKKIYDWIAYEALEIMAPYHDLSKEKIASIEKPKEKIVLR